MNTPQESVLEIPDEFSHRLFHEVHTFFVASFVSDILHHLNIFDEQWLPGMAILGATRSAAANFGNERESLVFLIGNCLLTLSFRVERSGTICCT